MIHPPEQVKEPEWHHPMERVSDLYFEIECARYFNLTIDDWWAKPEAVQILMTEHYKLHMAKEAYYAMDKEDRFFFFQGGRRSKD